MPYITLTGGLTIKVPTKGTTNWADTVLSENFQKISEHDHTGGGKGLQLTAASLQNNSFDGAKIRLNNDQYLRARNAANTNDINILKVDPNDELRLKSFKSIQSFAMTNNQSSPANITGLIIEPGTPDNSFAARIKYFMRRAGTANLYEEGDLHIFFNGTSFDLCLERSGSAGLVLSVTNAGQLQYTTTNNAGSTGEDFYYHYLALGA